MKAGQHPRSKAAIDAALTEFGGAERSALICVFFALARRLGTVIGSEDASELAYLMADELATKDMT